MKKYCLCSDFHNLTREVPSAHKMNEKLTKSFDTEKYYQKNELKNIQNDSWFDKFW